MATPTIVPEPTYRGAYGEAWKIDLASAHEVKPHTSVVTYIIRAPGQALWDHYMVSVVHLRDTPGIDAAIKHAPNMTHEFMLIALNPELFPTPTDPNSWQHLEPLNVVQQIECGDDRQAERLADLAARAICDGFIPAEPSLPGELAAWRESIRMTAEHGRTGGHRHHGGHSHG